MWQFLYELGLFVAKSVIIILFIVFVLTLVAKVIREAKATTTKSKKDSILQFIDYKEKKRIIVEKLDEVLVDEIHQKLMQKLVIKFAKKLRQSMKADARLTLLANKEKEQQKEKKAYLKDDNTKQLSTEENKELENQTKEDIIKELKTSIGKELAKQATEELVSSATKDFVVEYNDEEFILKTNMLFIVDFEGSPMVPEMKDLRKTIDIITDRSGEGDAVLLRLKSPGGTVNGYGLCAAQLERLKKKGIKLIVAVDEVAASGGYMMAVVADKIVAAPFAYIGSIGVVCEFPNFNRLMKKHNVDYEQITAGEYKRTLGQFSENTPEGREKFKQQLEDIHLAFKNHVKENRPNVDIDKVATGEHWIAKDAINLGLVDEIMTSDECLEQMLDQYNKVILVKVIEPKQKGLLGIINDRAQLTDFCASLIKKFTEPKV